MFTSNTLSDKPLLFLAPMDDITDFAFRSICKGLGADVTISEFVASEALIRNIEKTKRKLIFSPDERPFGIQIFGNNKESMCEAAQMVEAYKPDFIDINWGCPAKKIAGKGAGSGMLQNIPLLLDITQAVVKSVKTPVSVKTRLGYDTTDKSIIDLIEKLQDIGIKAITIHGRTKKQMFKGIADWTLIGEIKSNHRIHIPIIGNGDITTAEKALEMNNKYHLDGIMIGRAAIGNPWIFNACKSLFNNEIHIDPSMAERVDLCLKHLLLSIELKGEYKGLLEMRKHYKAYFKGLSHFKSERIKLLTLNNVNEIIELLSQFKSFYA